MTKRQRGSKQPKKPTVRGIIVPGLTRAHFDECWATIHDFTRFCQKNNKEVLGRELERDEVSSMFTSLIQKIYPADDPKSWELLGQVECPLYDAYWEERADERAFFEREYQREPFTFVKSRRSPTKAEKKQYPGCIRMKDDEVGELLVPEIYHRAMEQISFMGTVKAVLEANPHKRISWFSIQELWTAIISQVYHFEDGLDKEMKIGEMNECTQQEYRLLAQENHKAYEDAKANGKIKTPRILQPGEKPRIKRRRKKAKRERDEKADEELSGGENEEAVESEGERPGKKWKTDSAEGCTAIAVRLSEAAAQHLDEEDEGVGAFRFDKAAWLDFGGEQGGPAPFQFADTSLAFRFRG